LNSDVEAGQDLLLHHQKVTNTDEGASLNSEIHWQIFW
jgi:hypothetical protein